MKENLNKLEKAILERISTKYSDVKNHIPHLKILKREFTGVGMYISLMYENLRSVQPLNSDLIPTSLSTNESIEIEGLQYGLVFEVDVKNGFLNYIELITCGEEWNGRISDSFEFI